MMAYFSMITLLSLLFLLVIRKEFYLPLQSIFNLFVFYAYTESVILLISTVSKTDRVSYFVGMVISFIMPILYAVAYFKNNIWLDALNWLLPYKYLDSNWQIIYLILITSVIFFFGMYSFERKEL
ncbi:hypothetical protein D920_00271 [Enterococcus faecalis 13-SD-W-01]|nr:hypothetical protein D920_00271 [Enterococcus faecalis 13-SD-W-01]